MWTKKALEYFLNIIYFQLRYLQTLNSISAENNSTIVFPVPVDILSSMMSTTPQVHHPSVKWSLPQFKNCRFSHLEHNLKWKKNLFLCYLQNCSWWKGFVQNVVDLIYTWWIQWKKVHTMRKCRWSSRNYSLTTLLLFTSYSLAIKTTTTTTQRWRDDDGRRSRII